MEENKSKTSNVPRRSARSAGIYACATLYASPYVVATDKGYTKHYYVESERTASRIGGGGLSDIMRPVRQHQAVSRKVKANSEMTGRVFSDCLGTRHYKAQRVLNTLYEWRDSLKPEDDGYWYHPDHLGSSSWVTDTGGHPVQHLHYLPWGEDLVNQKSSGFDGARYTFSAKEKDTETGYSYFGARYYNSDLSIWLSVDPMSDKYPSLSPYTYCANNPVKLVDPNGEDYEVVVDEENKTITIYALYYTSNDNKEKLQKGLDAWNEQSGKYSFVTGDGNDKQSYTINFELAIVLDENGNAVENCVQDGISNKFSVESELSEGERGHTQDGYIMRVLDSAPDRTTVHEIGHTLGIGHFSKGVMETGGDGDEIYKEFIHSSIKSAKILDTSVQIFSEIEGAVAKSCSSRDFFMQGKIVRNR